MNRTTFLTLIGGLLSFSRLPAAKQPQVSQHEPLSALEEILRQLAAEFGTTVESCTGESNSHVRTIMAIKLPGQFKDKDHYLSLETQTTNNDFRLISNKTYDREWFAKSTLSIETYDPLLYVTPDSLARGIVISSGRFCEDGGFGIEVCVRTGASKATGEVELISAYVDIQRGWHRQEPMHPLHDRVIPLFELMTSKYSPGSVRIS